MRFLAHSTAALIAAVVLTAAAARPVPAATPTPAADEEIALRTRIVSAVVYADRAQVTRGGRVDVKPGFFRLVCNDLPQLFDEASLRVEGSGSARARIMGIDVLTVQGRTEESPRYKELAGKIEALAARRDTLQIELAALRSTIAYLDDYAKFPFEKGSAKLAAEVFRVQDWKNVVDFIGAERVKTNERIGAHEKRLAKLNEEIAFLQRQIDEMRMKNDWSKRVVVDLEAQTAGSLDLALSYNVPGASWNPEYTIRYRTPGETIDLGYNARVRQATGEDWNDVAVTLSTARPQIGAGAPELLPYYLQRRSPRFRMGAARDKDAAAAGEVKMAEMEQAMAPAPAETFEAETPGAELESTAFAASFAIPKKVDLPSGADPRRVLVLDGTLAAKLERYAAPRLSPNVFARGTVVNSLAAPILAGMADVYIESGAGAAAQSTFVGKAPLPTIATGQEFAVALGIDQDFKVTHKLEKKEYLAKEGAAVKKIRYSYLLTLESFKSALAAVKVQDRVPVSTLKEVRVTNVDLDPKPAEELENGIVTWNLSPAPKAKIEIRIAYTIEIPGDWDEYLVNLE